MSRVPRLWPLLRALQRAVGVCVVLPARGDQYRYRSGTAWPIRCRWWYLRPGATAAVGTDASGSTGHRRYGIGRQHVFLVTDPRVLRPPAHRLEIARSGRPGPVVIDIPKDVQNWSGPYRGSGGLAITGYRQRTEALRASALSAEQVSALIGQLAKARRPLIYAGGGVINVKLRQRSPNLPSTTDPVVTTLMASAASTPCTPGMHMLGMHALPTPNYAVEDCDFCWRWAHALMIGWRGSAQFAARARFIAHLDVDRLRSTRSR